MSIEHYPSIEYVRQCLRYEDGHLFWLERPIEHFCDRRAFSTWNSRFKGTEAGTPKYHLRKSSKFRWHVSFNGVHILRHVIVWALHNNEWRNGIDHRDRNPLNDRIENLRIATQSQNLANMTIPRDNTSGSKGVQWDKVNRKWKAQIAVRGHVMNLGRFHEKSDAEKAYMDAAIKYFGEFACDGKTTG